MVNQTAVVFRERLAAAVDASGIPSHRKASELAGLSAPQVGAILRGEYDTSRAGPGVFGMHRLASQLGVTLDDLLAPADAHEPSDVSEFNSIPREEVNIDMFVECYERGGRRLEAIEHLHEHFDLYKAPTEEASVPILERLGRQTLFAMRIRTTNRTTGQRELNAVTPGERRMILAFHRRVMTESIVLDCAFANHKAVSQPVHVRALSSRLGLLVTAPSGQRYVAVRCAPIPV